MSKFCDGINDCQDMSDETLCVKELVAVEGEQFTCLSGQRVDIHFLNDTVPDCPVHGDDEVWPSDSLPGIIVSNDSVMIACIIWAP